MNTATAPILIVGGNQEINDAVATLGLRGDRLRACPAPAAGGTNECIEEWLVGTSSPRYAAVFRLGEGSDLAAEYLRGHGVAVERFSDPSSLMAALNRFGQ